MSSHPEKSSLRIIRYCPHRFAKLYPGVTEKKGVVIDKFCSKCNKTCELEESQTKFLPPDK